jgi:hypothetical protein
MKKSKRGYAIGFVFVFLFSFEGFAQQQEYIAGKLLDSISQEPLVFANVRIKNRALGIITNVDGSFKIPLIYKEYGDIIEISSMGYLTKELLISDLQQDKLNIILIEPSAIELQEAIVRGKRKSNLNAKQIVQKAIDEIPRNYPSKSFSTIGYYRDYQFKDEEYLNLNEAILEVFDQGFDQYDDTTFETRLFNYGLNKNFKQDSIARAAYDYKSMRKIIKKAHLDPYGGNEFRILRIHDAIRNYEVGSYDFIGTLKTDLIENHHFLRSRDFSSENEALYAVKFWEIKPNYSAHGMIYISKIDFAIHKLEYTMYGKKRNREAKKNKHGHRQNVIFDIVTDYSKHHGKMYLNYISFQNSFEVTKPPKFKIDAIFINAPRRYCMLYFNKPVDSTSALRAKNYHIAFKQRKFDVDKIELFQDSVRVYAVRDFENATFKDKEELDSLIILQRDPSTLFDVRVSNVKDVDGNVVNEPVIENYRQFREFFVQRVIRNSRVPLDMLFMDKRKPIFKDQPIAKPDNFEDYWMNTPLKKVN